MADSKLKSVHWIKAVRDQVHKITPAQKLLLMSIASYADSEGAAYPSVETLAGIVCVSPRQIRTLVSQLAKAGHLAVEVCRSRFRTNIFRITGCYPQPRKPGSAPSRAFRGQTRNAGAADPERHFRGSLKPTSANQVLTNEMNKRAAVRSPTTAEPAHGSIGDLLGSQIAALGACAGNRVGACAPSPQPHPRHSERPMPMSAETRAKVEQARNRPVSPRGDARQPEVPFGGHQSTTDRTEDDNGRSP